MESRGTFNFPDGLNITPSFNQSHMQTSLHDRQRTTIETHGIAGISRPWKVASGGALSQGFEEASYLLARYLLNDSYGPSGQPQVEYDPPWLPGTSICTNAGGDSGILKDHPSTREKGASSDVVIELGSGMGTAGLAAAEALQRLQATLLSTGGSMNGVATQTNGPDELTVLNESTVGRETTSVVLTDLPEVCMLLRENMSMQLDDWRRAGLDGIMAVNKDSDEYDKGALVQLRIRKLSWGNEEHVRGLSKELRTLYLGKEDIDLTILCSDLVYFPHLLAPLLRTLIHLTSPSFLPKASTRAKIILSLPRHHADNFLPVILVIPSDRIRSPTKEMPFWRAFGRWFSFQPVLERRGEGVWRRLGWDESALSFVFVAHRRPETLTWHCPEEDQELLHGAGGDDTFELLLMLCNEALDD